MINIDLKITDYLAIFEDHKEDIMNLLAATMQTNRAMMFDKDGADNGKEEWAPLKWRSGRPLQHRGTLRKSFAPFNDGIKPGHGQDTIIHIAYPMAVIGTKLAYAQLMNDGTTKMPGGVLRPVKAKALKIPAPNGEEGFIFRKSVKIPARPMDTITEEDNEEIAKTVENYITEILNNG